MLISNVEYPNSQSSERFFLVPTSSDNRGCTIHILAHTCMHACTNTHTQKQMDNRPLSKTIAPWYHLKKPSTHAKHPPPPKLNGHRNWQVHCLCHHYYDVGKALLTSRGKGHSQWSSQPLGTPNTRTMHNTELGQNALLVWTLRLSNMFSLQEFKGYLGWSTV